MINYIGMPIQDAVNELKSLNKNSTFYETRDKGRLILDPLPNLYAPRDPFATIGNGVSLHKMYSVTRCRETIFGEYIFKYHPDYKKVKLYYDRKSKAKNRKYSVLFSST